MTNYRKMILRTLPFLIAGRLLSPSLPDLRVVNTDSVANRALVSVIAIMTFMSVLAVGAASMVRSASQDWSTSISNEITIQIKPVSGRDVISDQAKAAEIASKFRGVEKTTALSKSESKNLLSPWLGANFDADDLPIPQLITARISRTEPIDIKSLTDALRVEVPNSVVDDHRIWRDRLEKMSNSMMGVAFFILFLFVLTMGLAVSFATRGAMASSKEIVEVLHFVGASDKFIAREFQRHFLKLGMVGAVFGTGCALLFLWVANWVLQILPATSAEQVEALFGRMETQSGMLFTFLLVAVVMGTVTSVVSRLVATNLLKRSMQV